MDTMTGRATNEAVFLLLGDTVVFLVSLWLTLVVRNLSFAIGHEWQAHLEPFTVLFLVWVIVYFIAGLYDNHTAVFKEKLPGMILKAQTVNVGLAAVFFFAIPYFEITPKTNLLIYLVVSFLLLVAWRIIISPWIGVRKIKNAVLIASGAEAQELQKEVNANSSRYGMHFTHVVNPEEMTGARDVQSQLLRFFDTEEIAIVVADTRDEHIRELHEIFYNLTYLDQRLLFINFVRMYEEIFRRIPLSAMTPNWFLEHITTSSRQVQHTVKRVLDVCIGVVVTIVCGFVLPFVWLAIYFEDRGPLFVSQVRVGAYNRPVRLYKFRTMTGSDSDTEALKSTLRVTRVGTVLRRFRIDELPQGINLLLGGFSFIGPRPELPALASQYAEAIPYYNARHSITPGLTGWAQVNHEAHPHHGVDIEETRNKLSYDLYYVKHQSLLLDLFIGLKTIKTILTRSGK